MELTVGGVYAVHNQGTCITPQTVQVTVVWFNEDTVWYRGPYDSIVKDTPRARFEEIVAIASI